MDLKSRFILFAAVVLAAASCSGAGHRKVAGPPPEYELPEAPDAWAPPQAPLRPTDAGTQ